MTPWLVFSLGFSSIAVGVAALALRPENGLFTRAAYGLFALMAVYLAAHALLAHVLGR